MAARSKASGSKEPPIQVSWSSWSLWSGSVIEVEDIVPVEPAADYPRCLAGRRAGPPEDVGGTYGYAEFLEAILWVQSSPKS
jgi:hypothetical protein